ncbi:glycoside hydrolase [Rhypophila decipiens]
MIPRAVFAHYLVGLTFNQTTEQWTKDIAAAHAASIDGFALNIGASDHHTLEALQQAYKVAAKFDDFTLFISYDFAAPGDWTVDTIVNLTETFKDEPAQFKVDGKPLVSTFEGGEFIDGWKEVRKRVDGDIYFVPDWSGLGPQKIKEQAYDLIDGAFSFNAWPWAGSSKMTTWPDGEYTGMLSPSQKTYMMGVSPYFYTRIPELNKNWYMSSDSLWYDRWLHVLDIMPDMVQIVTWNDFGESHYIGDIVDSQVFPPSAEYVLDMSHKGFRAMLPYFIAAYKAGKKDIPLPAQLGDGAVSAWYRTTPANLTNCPDGTTVWGQKGTLSATAGVKDVINIFALSVRETTLTVTLGDAEKELKVEAGTPQFFQVPLRDLENETGNVTISMNGHTTEGPAITHDCPASGVINFNAVAIEIGIPKEEVPQGLPDGNEGGVKSSSGRSAGSSYRGKGKKRKNSLVSLEGGIPVVVAVVTVLFAGLLHV